MKTGRLFILGLLAFGAVAGLVVAREPGLRDLGVPLPLVLPLGVALLFDLALLPLVREGRIEPVTMNERAIGVVGAALIMILLGAVVPAA